MSTTVTTGLVATTGLASTTGGLRFFSPPGDTSEREHSGSDSDAAGDGAPTAGYGARRASRGRAVRPMIRLFGITVAGGLSSENRVFARLLSERGDRYDTLVVVHEESGAEAVIADHFAGLAKSPTVPIDTGWRPNRWTHRGNPRQARVALRYRRRLDRIIAAADGFEPGAVYSSQQHYNCRARRRSPGPCVFRRSSTSTTPLAPGCGGSYSTNFRPPIRWWPSATSSTGRRSATACLNTESRPSTTRCPHMFDRRHRGPRRCAPRSVSRRTSTFSPSSAVWIRARATSTPSPPLSGWPAERDDVVLVLVGSGRIERKIRTRADHSPVSDRIVMTGQRSDVPELLSLFDALVHPATQDPCPLAVLEAMAAALPVVAYADGGLPELVESGVHRRARRPRRDRCTGGRDARLARRCRDGSRARCGRGSPNGFEVRARKRRHEVRRARGLDRLTPRAEPANR